MEPKTTSSLLFKFVVFSSINNKINLRANKKRKTGGAFISREEPVQNEVDSDEFWDNLVIDEEEAPTHQEEEHDVGDPQPPLSQPKNLWTTMDDLLAWVDSMGMGMDDTS